MTSKQKKMATRPMRLPKSQASPLPVSTPSTTPGRPYEPTPAERAAIDAFLVRRRERKPAPHLKFYQEAGVPHSAVDHPDDKIGGRLIMESLGLSEGETFQILVKQIINVATKGQKPDPEAVNGMLAMVQAIEPRDMLEAMLAAQMAAVHDATMTFARRLNHVDTTTQQDSASNAFNKLARTFSAQIEALNRHRGKGQQAIRVEHVTVQAGGQAIVGSNVHPQGGGAQINLEGQAHAKAITPAPVAPLPRQDAARDALPVANSGGQEALPDARRGEG